MNDISGHTRPQAGSDGIAVVSCRYTPYTVPRATTTTGSTLTYVERNAFHFLGFIIILGTLNFVPAQLSTLSTVG